VHLVYSGQSCLAFEVGKLMDNQRMVEIINYHYKQQNNPSYPWGIVLNGDRKGTYIEI
ncbi:SAVED domain-containing protein, partial [Priestia megaterium]|uniref:SAVED domain-containing protein n=1 Tax=Priestia megaterium TaxID=1404 RepID=UPI001140F73B